MFHLDAFGFCRGLESSLMSKIIPYGSGWAFSFPKQLGVVVLASNVGSRQLSWTDGGRSMNEVRLEVPEKMGLALGTGIE